MESLWCTTLCFMSLACIGIGIAGAQAPAAAPSQQPPPTAATAPVTPPAPVVPTPPEVDVPSPAPQPDDLNRSSVISEMSRTKIVSTGNPNLMFDFNSFLSRWNPVTFEESLDFVKKVKARDYQLYLSLFDILSQKEQTPPEIYHNLLFLFQDHDDLCKELMRFKPHVRERRINSHNSFGMSLLLIFSKTQC
ncbi:hypothetical protein OPV22_027981 [Ensete ventricosum]|uniref:Uncharacterized protein n=1 Tax=Ensete ventricosum TaxID=4639 RepID=A0AAV8Q972_ENSVE|nr:hypothetical protein OPV22_027981 [Ensete ventricosum]